MCLRFVKRCHKLKKIRIKKYIVLIKKEKFFNNTTKYIGLYEKYYKKRWWFITVLYEFYVKYFSNIGIC